MAKIPAVPKLFPVGEALALDRRLYIGCGQYGRLRGLRATLQPNACDYLEQQGGFVLGSYFTGLSFDWQYGPLVAESLAASGLRETLFDFRDISKQRDGSSVHRLMRLEQTPWITLINGREATSKRLVGTEHNPGFPWGELPAAHTLKERLAEKLRINTQDVVWPSRNENSLASGKSTERDASRLFDAKHCSACSQLLQNPFFGCAVACLLHPRPRLERALLPYITQMDKAQYRVGIHLRSMQADGVSVEVGNNSCNERTLSCWEQEVETKYKAVLGGKVHRDRCGILKSLYSGKILSLVQCGSKLTSLSTSGVKGKESPAHNADMLFVASDFEPLHVPANVDTLRYVEKRIVACVYHYLV
eukprot:scaffold1085_cov407-Prasinococcus_capsulatus_cf.AAC.63